MKMRIVAGAVSLLVAVSLTVAEETTPSINAGSKAMLFTFSGLNALGAGSYNGGIGAKYFLTAPLALRGSLLFGYANQTVKTTATSGGKDGYNSALQFGLSAGMEYHFSVARVSPFFGAGVNFVTGTTTAKAAVNTAGGPEVTVTNGAAFGGIAPGNALTVGGIAGFEFFITKELSLSAEYQLGVGLPMGYTQTQTTVVGGTTTDVKTDIVGTTRIGIAATGFLTLAVYF